MDRALRDSILAVGGGVGVAGGLQWLASHLSLALVAGLCWATALKLVRHVGDRYPDYATGESWADKRWTGLSTGLVTLAALLGVGPTLPISAELRLGLGVLVLGAGLAAYTAGSLAVLERIEGGSGEEAPTADADGAPATDD
jgi:hypothetical protein